nr:hypothetical protein [uncultured Rhodopila sp.]
MQYVSGAAINGTYTLTQVAGTPCCWEATVNYPTIKIYESSNDCTDPPTATINSWTIRLCRLLLDGLQWYFDVTNADVQQFVSNPITIITGDCENPAGLPTFANLCNGTCAGGTFYTAIGGTAVITYP